MRTSPRPDTPPQTPPQVVQEPLHTSNKASPSVRFLLDMAGTARTRSRLQLQPAARLVVKPTDECDDETGFPRSSLWGKKELDMLGVRVQQTPLFDLNKVIGKVKPWNSEEQRALDSAVETLNSVDASTSGVLNQELQRIRNSCYHSFFKALHAVIQSRERKEDGEPIEGAPTTPTNREPPPLDPRLTGSSKLSGTSSEGKPEEATKTLANELLVRVLCVMDNDFRTIKWSESPWTTCIDDRRSVKMSFNLGGQVISPENDGGIQICYESPAKKTTTWKERIPVLSIEAKRKVGKDKKDKNILYRHAGQIFCEMLGQTCHKQFYTIQEMQYQEAFVIHAIHSSIIVYYAKLPNSFLAGIAKHGPNYLSTLPHGQKPPTVLLQQTKVYHLRDATERGEIFTHLTKLMSYLVSGDAHVGYLYNHPQNAIHKIVSPLFLPQRGSVVNCVNGKGVPQMKKDDSHPTSPVAASVSETCPIYDEIEVAPPDHSPPSSPETPATLGDVENSMEEDDPPRLDEKTAHLPMEDVKTDGPDDGSRMQLD